METTAVLCKTYGLEDESEFWRFPSHRILGVFDDPDLVANAISSLKSDFGDDDIEVFCGKEGEKQIDFTGERHGWWGIFMRSLENLSTERLFLEYYQKELHLGHYLLEVKVATSEEKVAAAASLNSNSAKRVTYFGNWLIEGMSGHAQEIVGDKYGSICVTKLPFGDALKRTKELLKQEGFGVLTEIDLKEKFKEKLGFDFSEYRILGACNPALAFEALQEDMELGLLLPCNVIVYERGDGSVVSMIDAKKMLSVTGNPKLETFAESVNQKLLKVIDNIPEQ